jgi:hypothetical protein
VAVDLFTPREAAVTSHWEASKLAAATGKGRRTHGGYGTNVERQKGQSEFGFY